MKKRQQIFELWKACFEDTEEFIRFYFDQKYQDENALVHEENQETVASLQMIPYPMTWAGIMIRTSYISGACTLPVARNKGIMTQLLTEAFRLMQQKGIDLSVLIPAEPWLYAYYGKMGYATIFKFSTETFYSCATLPIPDIRILFPENYSKELIQECYPYFSRHMSARPCCIQHPFEDFAGIVQDLYMSGGQLVTAHTPDTGKISGIAMVQPMENKIWISEMFFDSENVRETLLRSIEKHGDNKPVIYRTPPRETDATCAGMARIIDAGKMLAHYAAHNPEKSFTLHLTDQQIPENEGLYSLSNGICNKTEKINGRLNFNMDIAALTLALFGQHTETTTFPRQYPYMNLMFD